MTRNISPIFATPVMEVQLDLDLEKLIELAFQIQDKDKKGAQYTNRGGWHSNDISEEKHEEFIRLKDEINQYLQIYHAEVFRGMKFKGNVIQKLASMWTNINEKNHYNEWHVHTYATLSGVYYIKHDGSAENGNITFKNPIGTYVSMAHWPEGMVEETNEITSRLIHVIPKPNMLLIFPAWLEHKAEINLKNDSRISLSFNSELFREKNHNGKENENKT